MAYDSPSWIGCGFYQNGVGDLVGAAWYAFGGRRFDYICFFCTLIYHCLFH